MEINSPLVSQHRSDSFTELVLTLIRLRPRLMLPEHVRKFRKHMDKLREDGKGSPEDYQFIFRIFIILAHRPEPPAMGELSSELDIPFSTATRIVDWLVSGGFVERLPDAVDRRVVRVQMAPAGWSFYDISVGHIQHRIETLLQDFTPDEQSDLYHLISKLLVFLEQERQSPAA